MGLIGFILVVVVVGLVVWLAITYVPMPEQFKRALPILALVLIILALLVYVLGGVGDIPIPRLR